MIHLRSPIPQKNKVYLQPNSSSLHGFHANEGEMVSWMRNYKYGILCFAIPADIMHDVGLFFFPE